MTAPFPRTTCGCAECVRCCHEQPGCLVPGDMEKIAAHLGQTVEQIKPMFWASPGALLMNSQTRQTWRVGTITPRYDKQRQRCVFLDDADRCTIHAVAPAGCALADVHMDMVRGRQLGMWMVNQQSSPAYQALRDTLTMADHYKPRRVE